ncbi:MAG: glycosyltransferase, partial [Bacteroidota bacterium]
RQLHGLLVPSDLQSWVKLETCYHAWILHIIGSGPLSIPQDIPNILYEGFGSPQKVSEAMRDSRFLILPSFEDHWGLVVHEAACSGCGLITSDSVGAALDLINDVNGSVFKTNSPDSLYQNLIQAATKSDRQLELAYKTSLDLADKFGTHIWPKNLNKIIDDLAI